MSICAIWGGGSAHTYATTVVLDLQQFHAPIFDGDTD